MNQNLTNRSNNARSNISFQQKSTALSLVIISGATLYYFSGAWPLDLTTNVIPEGVALRIMTTIVLLILAQIVLQIVLTFGSGSAPAATAAEKTAALKASRNGYGVLTLVIFAAVGGIMLLGLNMLFVVNILVLGFATAEIVKLTSQLFYGGRTQ